MKRVIYMMDGIGSPADTSTGHGEVPSVKMNVIKPANETETISIPRKKVKLPDSPISAIRWLPDEPDGCINLMDGIESQTDMSSGHLDMPSVKTETIKPEIKVGNIRMG